MSYWFENPSQLYDSNKLSLVLPRAEMPYPEKVNAIVRLSIYAGIVASVIMRNYLYLYIPIITMLITYILYLFRRMDLESKPNIEALSQKLNLSSSINNIYDAQNELEHFTSTATDGTYPTQKNPFMNPLPFDSRTRPEAIELGTVSNNVEKYFNKNLFREVGDIFNKENSQREFYTVPSTTYPSHQESFANWLYKTPPTCKEGNGNQCVANNDERLYSGGGGSFKLPYITDKYNKKIFQ
jgi:hypothetical protein